MSRRVYRALSLSGLSASGAKWSTLRWAALPVTDRRWTAPLSAAAVAMGLFIGVAIGPGTTTTLGTEAEPVATATPAPATSAPAPDGKAPGSAAVDSSTGTGAAPADTAGTSVAPGATPSVTPPVSTPTFTPPIETTPATTAGATGETPSESTGDETGSGDSAEALVLTGTVLHQNPAANSYTLTSQAGQMSAIHTRDNLPEPGTKLEVKVRTLANGTYAEDGKRRRSGSRNVASFGGTVTFSDRVASVYTVSARGASVLVRIEETRGVAAKLPDVGSSVTVSGRIREVEQDPASGDDGPSWTPGAPSQAAECGKPPEPGRDPAFTVAQRSVEVGSDFVGFSDLEAVVQGVCKNSNRLIISADDVDEAQQNLSVALGDADVDLDEVEIGDVLALGADIDEEDGSLTLSSLADDGGIKAADTAAAQQSAEAQDEPED